ncbi:MAG: flagellar protein FliT [Pseudohongiellaceae bacterium]
MNFANVLRFNEPESEQQSLFLGYEALLLRLQHMIDNARAGDCSFMVQEKAIYLSELERLHLMESGMTLDGASQQYKRKLVAEVLQYSAELQKLLVKRRDALAEQIGQESPGSGRQYQYPVQCSYAGDAEERFDREFR